MEKISKLLRNIAADPGSYVGIFILILVVAASLYVIATASAAEWRHMYCTESEVQAIECTAKGWW